MISFKEYINENTSIVDDTVKGIMNTINKVDDNMSISDFSKAVSKIIIEQYGSHNYEKFLNIVKSEFDKQTKEDKEI